MTSTSPPPPPPAPAASPPPSRRTSRLRWRIALAVAAGVVIVAIAVTIPSRFEATTNDAYVEGDIVTVAPKVPGYVTRLDVDDNSRFKAGQELLQIDVRDYRNAVASAQADLANAVAARANAAALLAQQTHIIASARAALPGDRATLLFAGQQVGRYGPLAQGGYGSVEHLQQVQADRGVRASTLEKDEADLATAQSQTAVLKTRLDEADAEVASRKALLDQARLNLAYTHITADFDGTVANRIVRAGNYVQPGQALLSEVPARVYVIANYKETQIKRMRVGQAVSIHVDSVPDIRFRGHIDSFQRGTGSRFALLPPENATGNFVKVVQRVPVKILFDEPTPHLARLAPGMSVETTVSFSSPVRQGGS
ncbi:MAG TPA: HlyD family secretion protein [Caulobacteraceae bacterium]|jgi:membrane fusion protein (multidrug efflux system)